MNNRQKKKKLKEGVKLNPLCPKCGGWDGMVGHFRKGKTIKKEFMYCDSCGWEYKVEEKE